MINLSSLFTPHLAICHDSTKQKRKQWYVVHVLSGQENKVHDNLVKRIKTEEMSD